MIFAKFDYAVIAPRGFTINDTITFQWRTQHVIFGEGVISNRPGLRSWGHVQILRFVTRRAY